MEEERFDIKKEVFDFVKLLVFWFVFAYIILLFTEIKALYETINKRVKCLKYAIKSLV